MLSIFFTRHGESEANALRVVAGQSDSPLNENGIKQAHSVAEWAIEQGMSFDVIVSSPLSRSVQTAKIIARKLHYPTDDIAYEDDLKERNCGDFEGKPIDDYYETPESVAIKDYQVESLEALHERATRVIAKIQTDYPDKTVLLVSHSGIGKMLRIVGDGRDASEFDKTVSIPNATIMRLI